MAVTAVITVYPYPKGSNTTQRNQELRGTVTFTGTGTYPAAGLALNWSIEAVKALPSSATVGPLPIDLDFKSIGSATSPPTLPTGYFYVWDVVNGNMRIFQAPASPPGPVAELTGTVPAGVLSDTVQFLAVFTKNV